MRLIGRRARESVDLPPDLVSFLSLTRNILIVTLKYGPRVEKRESMPFPRISKIIVSRIIFTLSLIFRIYIYTYICIYTFLFFTFNLSFISCSTRSKRLSMHENLHERIECGSPWSRTIINRRKNNIEIFGI